MLAALQETEGDQGSVLMPLERGQLTRRWGCGQSCEAGAVSMCSLQPNLSPDGGDSWACRARLLGLALCRMMVWVMNDQALALAWSGIESLVFCRHCNLWPLQEVQQWSRTRAWSSLPAQSNSALASKARPLGPCNPQTTAQPHQTARRWATNDCLPHTGLTCLQCW